MKKSLHLESLITCQYTILKWSIALVVVIIGCIFFLVKGEYIQIETTLGGVIGTLSSSSILFFVYSTFNLYLQINALIVLKNTIEGMENYPDTYSEEEISGAIDLYNKYLARALRGPQFLSPKQ